MRFDVEAQETAIGRLVAGTALVLVLACLVGFPDARLGAEVAFGAFVFGVNAVVVVYWGAAFLGRPRPPEGGRKHRVVRLRFVALSLLKLGWLGAACWLGVGILDVKPLPLVGGALAALFCVTLAAITGCRFLYRVRTI